VIDEESVVEGDSLEVEPGNFEVVPHWLLFDDRATANAVRLYLVLRSYAMGKGTAFPSRKTLADDMQVSLPTLDSAKACLIGLGALTVTARRQANGNQTSNLYHVAWGVSNNLVGGQESLEGGAKNISRGGPKKLDTKHTNFKHTNFKQSNDPETLMQKPVVQGGQEGFDEFWKVYPRKENRGKARIAYEKARKSTPQEVIVEGAVRYRDDPSREAAFTAHGASWLNGERWSDELLPSRDAVEVSKVPVTFMDTVSGSACEHGEPRGVKMCALCRKRDVRDF